MEAGAMYPAARRYSRLSNLKTEDLWKEALSLCDEIDDFSWIALGRPKRRELELRLLAAVRMLHEAGEQLRL
jgi:hypothetical protein